MVWEVILSQYRAVNVCIHLQCSVNFGNVIFLIMYYDYIHYQRGRRVIGISGSLIWSKTLMELIFNSCGEFRWSSKVPVSQIHSPNLHVGAPGIFSDLLRFVQMLKRESGVWKGTGIYHTCSSLVKLQPRFLSLQWKTCLWAWVCSEGPALGQNTHDDDDISSKLTITNLWILYYQILL